MSKYVFAFRGQPDRMPPPDAQELWGAWFAELGAAVVDPGSQVGVVRTVPSDDPGDPGTAAFAGYTVIDAADLDAAARLAAGCPGLKHGVSVEVGEVMGA